MILLDHSRMMEYLFAQKETDDSGRKKLVVLPDITSIRNFNYSAASLEVSLTHITTMTIEELAEKILDPEESQGLRIIDKRILGQLILKGVKETPDESLKPLSSVPLTNQDTQESLADEFDDYLRCVGVDLLIPQLADVANKLDDPFHAKSSGASIRAFASLEKVLAGIGRTLGSSVFISRSHLVKKATDSLRSSWPDVLDVSEVLVSSISVLDAPTLSLLAVVAQRGQRQDSSFVVRLFQGAGTYSSLKERLANSGIEFKEESPSDSSAIGAETDLVGEYARDHKFQLKALPDRRREVEEVARRVRELLVTGVHPSEVLLVTRDSGKYLPFVEEVFPAYGIPYYVQTRRPFAQLPPYRFLKATLDLIVAAKEGTVEWDQITDPLRLGFCLPGGGGSWPLASRQFIYLEESLPRLQRKLSGKQSVADWIAAISTLKWEHPRGLLTKFLEWVQQRVNDPPSKPEEARRTIATLLGTYMFQESVRTEQTISPYIFGPERFLLHGLHPTHFAARIRGSLVDFVNNISDYVTAFGRVLDWELADQVFGETFGSQTYGLPDQDLASVKMVDAGTVFFVRAKHLFILGLKSDEFPRKTPKGVFLSDTLREALDLPDKEQAALLYLRSSINDYANEYDFLQAVFQTKPDLVTCTMPYLDEEGNVSEWSPFVERLATDKSAARVRPDEWLPVAETGNWMGVVRSSPPWVRERLYLHHSRRQFPLASPRVEVQDIATLASGLDKNRYTSDLVDRLERYLSPPPVIKVEATEPWFTGPSLNDVAGSPLRAYEMDLHGTCPLQYYFFQFLYRWTGKQVDRNEIPWYTKLPNWRYGRLPRRLAYFYLSSLTQTKIGEIIKNRFPSRQGTLSSFASSRELRTQLSSFLSEFELVQLGDTLEDEWSLVRQEQRDNITRQWSWVDDDPEMQIGTSEKISIVVPHHRLDELQDYKLIMTYVNFSRQIENREGRIFYDKTRRGIERAVDPLRDYEMAILLTYYMQKEKIAGATYVELFDGKRLGYYNQSLLQKHKGPAGYSEELRMHFSHFKESWKQVLSPTEWRDRAGQFQTLVYQRAKMMSPRPDVSYEATPSEENCTKCVYNDLCQLPRANRII